MDVKFSKEIMPGDGLFVSIGKDLGILYATGFIVNDKYAVGTLRFLKQENGSRELTKESLVQHKNVPEEVYGRYKQVSTLDDICDINDSSKIIQIIPLDNILYVFEGKKTFDHNCTKYDYAQVLRKNFPAAEFLETGSLNVGLGSSKSDIDIYILKEFENVSGSLRQNLEQYGLQINTKVLQEEVTIHCKQYGFSEKTAKEICRRKLAGLEFNRQPITFFDSSQNLIGLNMLQSNCSEQITISGKVIADTFAGHWLTCYTLADTENYDLVLPRKIYPKQKRYILKKEDRVKTEGILIRKDPNIVLAENISIV